MSSPGFLWLLTKRIMAGSIVGMAISDEVMSIACMHGRSMHPTLNPGDDTMFGWLKGDMLLLDKIVGLDYRFSRGDVVVFRSPQEPKEWMVKRLIALQGDWVSIPGSREILKVPQGHCWVEGDNLSVSLDSRNLGPIPIALLKARVTHIVWPPNRVGHVESRPSNQRVMIQNGRNQLWGKQD